MSYYAIVTSLGAAKFAALVASGQQLVLQDFAVGDGNGAAYDPVATQTALLRETYRGALNSLVVDPDNVEQVIIECLIPENSGGWHIRELGIFDEDGDMILIAKYPETYKPSPADGALLKQFTIKMIMQVGSPDNVTLSVTAGSIATIEYVDDKKALLTDPTVVDLSNDDNYLTPHVFANLAATVDQPGVVQLADDLEVQGQSIPDKAITPASMPSLRATLNQLKAGADNRFLTPDVLLQLLATTAQKGLTTLATDVLAQAMASTTTVLTPKNLVALKATLAELEAGNSGRLISPDVLLQLLATTTQKGLVELATGAETLAQTAADLAVTPAGLASLIATAAEAKAGSNAVKYITPAALLQVLATTTQKGLVELATDAETTALTADNVVVTPGNLGALLASTTQKGLVELATAAETLAQTAADKVVTPASLTSYTDYLIDAIADVELKLKNPIVITTILAGNNQTLTLSASLTAPVNGVIMVTGNTNYAISSGVNTSKLTLDSITKVESTTSLTRALSFAAPVNAGAHTIQLTTACSTNFDANLSVLYIPNLT